MRLSELNVGESASITKINGPAWLKSGLEKMGVVAGVKVKIMRKAPFSSPIQIKIKNYYVAIRLKEAFFVEVCGD